MQPVKIRTEDGAELQQGDRAYNYYDMRPGTIGRMNTSTADPDPWFDFEHDDGSRSLLNGARICSIAYAIRRGFPDAAPPEPEPEPEPNA